MRNIDGAASIVLIAAIANTPALAQNGRGNLSFLSPFSVGEIAIGAPFFPEQRANKDFKCKKSEVYTGFTWCERTRFEDRGGNTIQVHTSIIHAPDGTVAYVNKSLKPAFFDSSEAIDNEIMRLTDKFNRNSPNKLEANVQKLADQNAGINVVMATWGGIKLNPLAKADIQILAKDKSPRKGVLVDYIGNIHESARANYPVYLVSGGEGFVYVANYDQEGTGGLRFFAMDPSLLGAGGKPSIQSDSTETASISMQPDGGVYVVPIRFNDVFTLNAIVDSGASEVSVPADVASTLIRAGTIAPEDFLGEQITILADGSKVPSKRFVIHSLKVGDKTVENVPAFISSAQGPILLGQSFLKRFRRWSVDNDQHILRLE